MFVKYRWICLALCSSLIMQNHPNTFNESTLIGFRLSRPNFVVLRVYNLLGKEIETLVEGQRSEGEYKLTWNAKDLPSGIYLFRLEAGGYVNTKKLILQR